MANEEHVALLKQQGVAGWNAWREKNPDARPDLSHAKLSGRDLPYADLQRADLRDTDFHNASLRYANLTGAKPPACTSS